MINLLRNKNPFNIILLALYAIALKLVLFIHPPAIDESKWSAPLSRLTFHFFQKVRLENPVSFSVLSIILLLAIALYFNAIVSNYKFNSKGVFLPALMILLAGSFNRDFCELSPALIGLIFLVACISKIFSLYKMEQADGIMFDAGFLVSLASLFYFSYIVFVLFLLIGFLIVRPFNIREYVIGIAGVIIPYFLLTVIYYWNSTLPGALHIFSKYYTGNYFPFPENSGRYLSNLGVLLLLLLWSSFSILNYYSKIVMHHRLIIVIIYIFFCAGTTSILLIANNSLQHFIWLIIPVSFTTSIAIAELRKRWLGEIMHLCLILLLIYFQYLYKS